MMKRALINGLSLWQFELFQANASIRHFITGRNSVYGGKEFTLSFSSSPDRGETERNRTMLASAMGIKESELYIPRQVHEARVLHVTRLTAKDELTATDALITDEKGICIAVMSADCVTILLHDRKNRAIGAVHAGWRGTVAKILEKTLQEMYAKFGTRGEDVTAGIGPSICQQSYEVGEEVIQAINNAFGKDSGLMITQPGNKAKLDLWKANKLQLLQFGVRESDIEISGLCTLKNNDHFFSARKGDAGRFAAGIMLI